jgi:hypothetical protein
MRHLLTTAITAAALLLAAGAANAQMYLGAGAVHFDDGDVGITSAVLTYDLKPSPNFGFQIALATGGDDEYQALRIGTIEVELDYALTAKGKFGLMLGDAFVYGMAGYSSYNLEAKLGRYKVSEDGNGSLVGVGVDFFTSATWGFGVEYARGYADLEDTNIFQAVVRYGF